MQRKLKDMKNLKVALFLLSIFFMITLQTVHVYAYYNRGKVQINLAATNVETSEGKTYNLSVKVSPESYTGLPGCGLAQCPNDCLDSCEGHMNGNNGQCQCGGYTKQTANTALTIQVADTSIASASYSGGVLSITGIRPGQTTITVQGTLWEHENSDEQKIRISVTKKSVSDNSGETGAIGPDGIKEKPDTVVPVEISPDTANGAESDPIVKEHKISSGNSSGIDGESSETTVSKEESPDRNNLGTAEGAGDSDKTSDNQVGNDSTNTVRTVNTTMAGTFKIVTLNSLSPTGKTEMQISKENKGSVTFQKLDSGQRVSYSWTFQGDEMTDPQDIGMGIEFKTELPYMKEETKKLLAPLYLTFDYHGALPGKAKITVSVGGHYQDGQKLSLYYLNGEKNTLDLTAENLEVKNGYVSFELEHCSDYVLTTGMNIEKKTETGILHIILIGILIPTVIIGGSAGIFFFKKSKNSRGGEKS